MRIIFLNDNKTSDIQNFLHPMYYKFRLVYVKPILSFKVRTDHNNMLLKDFLLSLKLTYLKNQTNHKIIILITPKCTDHVFVRIKKKYARTVTAEIIYCQSDYGCLSIV